MVIRADARALPLRDGCVDCVVTSPPYWGLRDYGTASWTGGDPDCQHVGTIKRTVSGGDGKQYTNVGSNRVYSGDCVCGAERVDAQLGLERTPEAYVAGIVAVCRELARVLKPTGTVWLNLGDSYYATGQSGGTGAASAYRGKAYLSEGVRHDFNYCPDVKPKNLIGMPWRVAFALQADGWYLRADIIWAKPNPMPESVTDRPTKAHEYLFLLTKRERYYYDAAAIREPQNGDGRKRGIGPKAKLAEPMNRSNTSFHSATAQWSVASDACRNRRSVWTINTEPYEGAHFATFPEALVEPCILAGCPLGGLVLDPFLGSGTVGAVAERLSRRWVGTDLAYHDLATERTAQRGFRFEWAEAVS